MSINENLGAVTCPVCGNDTDLKITKKSKSYLNCAGCGCQVFARGALSDSILRGKVRGEVAQAPAVAQSAQPAAATVRRHSSETGETTIFDILGNLARGKE